MKKGEKVVFVFCESWSLTCLGASVSISWYFAFVAVHGLHCQLKQKRNRRKWNAHFVGLTFGSSAVLFGREFEMIIQNDFSLWMTGS